MDEPLKVLLKNYGFEPGGIEKIVSGLRYTAVLLRNGNIGVCANLGNRPNSEIGSYSDLKPDDFSRRIVLNAYFNALLNYEGEFGEDGDIFEVVDFRRYKRVAMIGLFKPLVEKFQENDIPLSVFDLRKQFPDIGSSRGHEECMKEADAVILTSTSIFNNTFLDIVNNSSSGCEIFMLGPSSIMSGEVLRYRNIKMIFGAAFEKRDERVLEFIANDAGTRKFLKLGRKRIFTN